ncbi:uncharacterized protein LOC131856943 [Cryptomeria japonica]|uniref:uncharacterized protein LOC131856943 n=1 Tax=Cryptomeria japonica TaxID=3369 RepID=UPI0027DA295B|nr:uncharacterized protein LOC131856943 [Cryptomeria japonica]
MSNEEYYKEKALKEELAELIRREELFWRDKSRELWIKEGDANTKKFHASVKAKRSRNRIDSIVDKDGNRRSSLEAIEEVAVNFFRELLGDGSNDNPSHPLTDVIHREVTDADNISLCCPFSLEKVKKVVFDLHPNKAPGPDGFTMDFYQRCWGFLGHEILIILENFRKQVNGNVNGFFHATNGLRQGDPLSPFLFVLMAEFLGRSITNRVRQGLWKGVSISTSMDPISHSQFADDTILFGEASEKEAYIIKGVLDDYEKVSEQCMNKKKSMIYFLNTSRGSQLKIFVPIYYMSCYRLSCKATSALDGMLKKFLCKRSKEAKKIPLINWDTACLLKEDGGAGLRQMKLQNLALGAKLAWKMYNAPQKGWCKVMAAKYLDSSDPERIFTVANSVGGSSIWRFIWESRKLITDHLTWRIGNGKKAKFWRDSWNGELALANIINDNEWINQIEANMGVHVADYVESFHSPNVPISWKRVGDRLSENNLKLEEILNSRKTFVTYENDTLVWNAAKSGKYRVNLGYELQRK